MLNNLTTGKLHYASLFIFVHTYFFYLTGFAGSCMNCNAGAVVMPLKWRNNPDSKGVGNLQELMNSVMTPPFQLK